MRGSSIKIIAAIESGITQAIPIAEHTGVPLSCVYARLHDLKRIGAVRSFRVLKTEKPRNRRYPAQQRKRYMLRTGCWK